MTVGAAGSARWRGWLATRRYARFVVHPLDPADYKAAAFLPEISRDIYLGLPEDPLPESRRRRLQVHR